MSCFILFLGCWAIIIWQNISCQTQWGEESESKSKLDNLIGKYKHIKSKIVKTTISSLK